MFVLFINIAENTGRVNAFSLGVFDSESVETPTIQIQANAVNAKNFNNKDSLIYNEVDMLAKGGPGDSEYTDVGTTGDDSLMPNLAALTTYTSKNERDKTIIYTVKSGDNVSKIAAEFGVTINTVLWANNLRATSYIKEGQELKILPVTGIQHDVKKGETVSGIAKKYKVKASDIIAYNGLPADGSLQVGETLIIEDGEMPQRYSAPRRRVISYAKSTINASKYFIFPTKGRKTQGIHGYNAVDVANRCGTPIYAAASGTIVSAKTTRSRARLGASVFGGYGNYVKIKHSNGTNTLYAHMKNVFVRAGQAVKQGQQIGVIGGGFEYINGRLFRMQGAGKSTGCHLHFEVRGAKNPLANYWRY